MFHVFLKELNSKRLIVGTKWKGCVNPLLHKSI